MKLNFSIIASILFLVTQSASFAVGQGKSVGAAGTDIPLHQRRDSQTGSECFVYNKYVFKTKPTEDGFDDIIVFKRDPMQSWEKNCAADKNPPYMTYPANDFNFFYGLAGDNFFVDSGTSAGERGLTVVSLTLKKEIYATSYMNDAKVVGNTLVYDNPTDKKGSLKNCPEYRKWRKIGGGEGWVQTRRLDLTTLKETAVGNLKCVYLE